MRISIESAKTKPGADCSSDHELLIAKFRLKLKKVGKTTRQLSHELSQIPYTVSVTNRFQGSDLIECVRRTMGEIDVPIYLRWVSQGISGLL